MGTTTQSIPTLQSGTHEKGCKEIHIEIEKNMKIFCGLIIWAHANQFTYKSSGARQLSQVQVYQLPMAVDLRFIQLNALFQSHALQAFV